MSILLTITSSGNREFRKLPQNIRKEVFEKLNILKENPLKGEPLRGKSRGLRSLHFTVNGVYYRAIYEVLKNVILIHLVGTRENIYRKLERTG